MVDIEKYEFIVEKYTRPLFQYCYYRLDENSALTEETMDDIMHLLYQKWESLDVDGNIRAWLYRVADNTIKYNKKNIINIINTRYLWKKQSMIISWIIFSIVMIILMIMILMKMNTWIKSRMYCLMSIKIFLFTDTLKRRLLLRLRN